MSHSASCSFSTPSCTSLTLQCRSESTNNNLESIQPKPDASRRDVPPECFQPPCLERETFRPLVPEHVGGLPITIGKGEALRPTSRTGSLAAVTSNQSNRKIKNKKQRLTLDREPPSVKQRTPEFPVTALTVLSLGPFIPSAKFGAGADNSCTAPTTG